MEIKFSTTVGAIADQVDEAYLSWRELEIIDNIYNDKIELDVEVEVRGHDDYCISYVTTPRVLFRAVASKFGRTFVNPFSWKMACVHEVMRWEDNDADELVRRQLVDDGSSREDMLYDLARDDDSNMEDSRDD